MEHLNGKFLLHAILEYAKGKVQPTLDYYQACLSPHDRLEESNSTTTYHDGSDGVIRFRDKPRYMSQVYHLQIHLR
jgi:hypothetical protein